VLSVLALTSQSTLARTVATQSVRDIGAALNFTLAPKHLQSAQQAYLADCNKSVEGARVHEAVLFGENNLDDMRTKHNEPNQCSSKLGAEAPPTGQLYKIRNGVEEYLETADTVMKNDVIVTAAHAFKYRGKTEILPSDKIVFRVWQNIYDAKSKKMQCEKQEYSISLANVHLGTEDAYLDPCNDFAVIKLDTPVRAYEPLELAPDNKVRQAATGEVDLLLTGFAYHESTNWGEDLSMLKGRVYDSIPSGSRYAKCENAFEHDMDSTIGLSGGKFTYVDYAPENTVTMAGTQKKYVRYMTGINVAYSTTHENVEFNPQTEYNVGIGINDHMRAMIEEVAGEDEPVIHTAEANRKNIQAKGLR
jgi:hypothetical protein